MILDLESIAHSRVKIAAAAAAGTFAAVAICATHPVAYAAALVTVQSVVTCVTTTACVAGTNGSSGPGVAGTSKTGLGTTGTSTSGVGVYGLSASSNGVGGTSTSGYGVSGYSSNSFGVQGTSPGNAGVVGISSTNTGIIAKTTSGGEGLYAYTLGSGDGAVGAASSGIGVLGEAGSGDGVWGSANGSGVGTGGTSSSGYGVYASSSYGTALRAYSGQGVGVRSDIAGNGFSIVGTSLNGQGAGADFEGGRYGIVGRAESTGFPLVLTDSNYNNVFYVSGTGDVFYQGNLQPFLRTNSGATVGSYTAKLTQPTVEDTGSAQLSGGAATVMLDPTFSATIDRTAPYRVFLTPDGDTRGLFIAVKTTRGFLVREAQGGRSNLAFDYRIVATGIGQTGKRMGVASAVAMPRTPVPAAATVSEPKHPNDTTLRNPVGR